VSQPLSKRTWHENFNWRAEDYFDDPQVVALCKAIELNDLGEIDRLVAAGADVNAKGKGNMTPLLWAFPDNQLARFTRLLEHGADPNVYFESDYGTRSAILPGETITHLATQTKFPGYFEAVFQHGGNPNLAKQDVIGIRDTPIFTAIKFSGANRTYKVKTLIEKGADLNYVNGTRATPVMQAVSAGGQFDLALLLLESGADFTIYAPKSNTRLIHIVAGAARTRETWTPQQKVSYDALVRWLEDKGESLEQANADIARWHSWSATTGEAQRKIAQEVAERQAREAREKEANAVKQPDDAKQAEKQ
jgi:ankyrin repeat protein